MTKNEIVEIFKYHFPKDFIMHFIYGVSTHQPMELNIQRERGKLNTKCRQGISESNHIFILQNKLENLSSYITTIFGAASNTTAQTPNQVTFSYSPMKIVAVTSLESIGVTYFFWQEPWV